ncbi:mpv17-like protein isoform X3 [Schistocerca gregaria]|uniref:mpv17-like protein isoform X3 n=1 Tax=Schistocerca gregaria TaxID=7010 RepID=UPI00211EF1DF|nr:mpv17-like protein isoform X3 [Schistocerca gregaria]
MPAVACASGSPAQQVSSCSRSGSSEWPPAGCSCVSRCSPTRSSTARSTPARSSPSRPSPTRYSYRWLDRRFVGTAAATVLKKMLLDQFVLTPPLLVAFYVSMSLMERKKDLFEECRNKLVPTFKTSCLFWMPAQLVNFMWVPPAARVIYVGSCALVWVNILCWFKRQDY